MQKGKLQLFPNLLDETREESLFFPVSVKEAVSKIGGLIAGSEKSARRYLRRFVSHEHMTRSPLRLLNEHTSRKEMEALLEPMLTGEVWVLFPMPDCLALQTPGPILSCFLAHTHGIDVETFVGPCSILLALQLSGFSGQRFAFHGYSPRENFDLEMKIKELEKQSAYATQIWIEAPHRSAKMLEQLKTCLQPTTFLCVATNLTSISEKVMSWPIAKWRSSSSSLQKEPAIFLISQK